MMKGKIIYAISVLACCAAVCSCQKEELDTPHTKLELKLTTKVAEMGSTGTKADLIHNEDADNFIDKTLTLYGWEGDTYFGNPVDAAYNTEKGKWELPSPRSVKTGTTYSFLSYANLPTAGATITPPESKDGNMTLSVTDITAAQNDILLGKGTKTFSNEDEDVEITYTHPFASVEFALGNAPNVKSVTSLSLSGIYAGGKTTYSLTSDGYTWDTSEYKANATLEKDGLSEIAEGVTLATLVVIPQDLTSKSAMLTVLYTKKSDSSEGRLVKSLNEGEWTAGYTTRYSIFNNSGEVGIEIDGITPKNTGSSKIYVRATITGAWYDTSGNVVAPWSTADGTFSGLPGTNWEKSEDIYYYKEGLGNEESAKALYSSYTAPVTPPVADATLKMDILVQAIPYDASKTCRQAFEAL